MSSLLTMYWSCLKILGLIYMAILHVPVCGRYGGREKNYVLVP